ncbi:MAG: glucosamine-6-phosphate deaminase [Treponema sp.]|jgi:glucosamine-6-phosphate deaminase|nr:glucosamine-6-phosphate deaminase [Treponema sp.]
MRLVVKKDYNEAARWTADYIVEKINKHTGPGPFRLGLPTGSSPLGVYRELVAMHRAKKVSFADVVTFNMDEYLGLPADHPQSYHRFMWDNFFSHVDIRKENVHILDGMARDPEAECEAYDREASEGGFDLFLGGVGQNGHLAFNEPGSSPRSRTRVITLTADTRTVNARFFEGDADKVPEKALSVGMGTVLDAKEVLIIITGYNKARALKAAVEGGICQMWPISFLQTHPKGIIVCDGEAVEELTVGTLRHFRGIEGISP